jgi:hypothetical protein
MSVYIKGFAIHPTKTETEHAGTQEANKGFPGTRARKQAQDDHE